MSAHTPHISTSPSPYFPSSLFSPPFLSSSLLTFYLSSSPSLPHTRILMLSHTSLPSSDCPVPHLSTPPSPSQTPLNPTSPHLPTPAFDPLFYLIPPLVSHLPTPLRSPHTGLLFASPQTSPHLTLPCLSSDKHLLSPHFPSDFPGSHIPPHLITRPHA